MILQRLQELQSGRVLFEYALRRPLQLSLAQRTGTRALDWPGRTLSSSRDKGHKKPNSQKKNPHKTNKKPNPNQKYTSKKPQQNKNPKPKTTNAKTKR